MKILHTKTIQQKFLINSVSRLSTASSNCQNHNEITKDVKLFKTSEIMPVSNISNQSLLNSKRFSTTRFVLNFNVDRKKSKANSEGRGTTWNPRGLTGHSGKKHPQGDKTVVYMIIAFVIMSSIGLSVK